MLERPRLRDASRPTRAPADFAEHLANLEAAGLLMRIDREVNKDTELHPLVRWQFRGGLDEADRRAFLFTNVVGADGRRFDMPVAVGALSASADIYAFGMGRPVEEIGRAWTDAVAHPIAPVAVTNPPCQEVVITGADLVGPGNGLSRLPVPVSTPGFDAAPYLTATLCVTVDPDTGVRNMGTYRAQLKASDRLGVRMASRIGGAGGYLHWQKYRARKQPMPCAIVVGCAPVVAFTGPQKLAIDLDEIGVAGGARRLSDPHGEMRDARSRSAGRCRDRGRGADRSRTAGARRPVRRKPRLRGARGLQHVDAGHRHHPSSRAAFRVDHQPGDAVGIERDQARRLRADVPLPPARPAVDQGHPPRRPARAAEQRPAGDLPAVCAGNTPRAESGAASTARRCCGPTAARSSSP